MIRAVLCDIEGTTTSISFAHDVLFPDSYEKMDHFIRSHWNDPSIDGELKSIQREIPPKPGNKVAGPDEVIALLRSWIKVDKKETNLKSIQGKIWKESFESGAIRGHVYPDVPARFKKWKSEDLKVAIFSSGSVEAQKLIFRYSEAGDLTSLIEAYFDTTTGPKKEATSYRMISQKLGVRPEEVLFLSDVEAELDAASEAGMHTTLMIREKEQVSIKTAHRTARSFAEVLPEF